MGFEVTYLYHNKKDAGGYDAEETKNITKKIGDPFEDIPLEKLAAVILMQMARRDIWVVDVKITELKKKEIVFKESNDGIVIKNKKFTLDSIANALKTMEDTQYSQPTRIQPTSKVEAKAGISAPHGMVTKKIEIFDPEPDMLQAGMVQGKLTAGKKYPIFEERRDPREATQGPLPILYITIDDNGRKVVIPEPCFRPLQRGLIGGDFENNSQKTVVDGLSWNGVIKGNTDIDIRARR